MCEDSTLGRICKSAPTVFINYMAQAVTFVQWQYFFNSPTCPPKTQRTCTSDPFIYQIYANHNLVTRSGWVCAGRYRRADMRFRLYISFHVVVLHNVTPFVRLQQTAVLVFVFHIVLGMHRFHKRI